MLEYPVTCTSRSSWLCFQILHDVFWKGRMIRSHDYRVSTCLVAEHELMTAPLWPVAKPKISGLFFEDGFWHKLSWEPVITSRWWWPLAFSRTVWWWKYWEGSGGLNPLRKRHIDYWSTSKAIVMYQLLAKVSHKPSTIHNIDNIADVLDSKRSHIDLARIETFLEMNDTLVCTCAFPTFKTCSAPEQTDVRGVFLECTCKGP